MKAPDSPVLHVVAAVRFHCCKNGLISVTESDDPSSPRGLEQRCCGGHISY